MSVERTYSIPHCEKCPPLSQMPTQSLVRGMCPRCGKFIEGKVAARILVARRLIERIGA